VFAEGFPQEDRRGRVAVGHDRDVHADYISQLIRPDKTSVEKYMTTNRGPNCYLCLQIEHLSLITGGTSV
jgi:hypothetical protein